MEHIYNIPSETYLQKPSENIHRYVYDVDHRLIILCRLNMSYILNLCVLECRLSGLTFRYFSISLYICIYIDVIYTYAVKMNVIFYLFILKFCSTIEEIETNVDK